MKKSVLAASILAAVSGQLSAATYQLTELPLHSGAKHTYVVDANDNGDMIGQVRGNFNRPIDVSYIDFDDSTIKKFYDDVKGEFELIDKTITFTLEDIKNGAAATNADANDFMVRFLANRANNAEFQKLVDGFAIRYIGNSTQEQVLFDVASSDYDGLTRSVSNFLNALADDGVMAGWGTAPFSKKPFTNKDNEEKLYFETPWISRGIVITPTGEKITLEPKYTEFGGMSKAMDIAKLDDGSYLVAGQSSVAIAKASQEIFDDNCDGEDESVAVCTWIRQLGSFFMTNGYIWKLDQNFNVVDTTDLGLGLTPNDNEEGAYVSGALAINKNGIAVGFSPVRFEDNKDYEHIVAGYFKDGGFHAAPKVIKSYENGKATDINDHNVMVGFQQREIPGGARSVVGFYYDIDSGESKDIQGFFPGSDVAVTSINNAGVLVGQAEVDRNTQNSRREAFLYKIGDEKITNINNLLPCKDPATGENFKYTVAEANKITDGNVIYGTATKTVEKRDSLGNVVKDVDGKTEYESIAVPVVLTPISGEVESCLAPEVEKYERQSASWGWLTVLLAPLVAWRRRQVK
ncbi:DUF3466 family protein [Pseudoalteromonas fenneropenaei]|uniref:DUF3466 family protein n=1 Tax=Pseudoalteromonas fenneropenaei TaxID=1737459 RepID=A0ABV7CHQ9_9GAMM